MDTAIEKVRLAEDAWNGRSPERVALAYTPDSQWRNRAEFVNGCMRESGPDQRVTPVLAIDGSHLSYPHRQVVPKPPRRRRSMP